MKEFTNSKVRSNTDGVGDGGDLKQDKSRCNNVQMNRKRLDFT